MIRNGLMFLFNLGTKIGLNVKLLYEFDRKNIKDFYLRGAEMRYLIINLLLFAGVFFVLVVVDLVIENSFEIGNNILKALMIVSVFVFLHWAWKSKEYKK